MGIALAAISIAAACTAGGCGSGTSRAASAADLSLQRAQFVQVVAGLRSVRGAVAREVARSRQAWPGVASGLSGPVTGHEREAIVAASAAAKALPEPSFITNAPRLTGPAAGLAGLYESFERLAGRGWLMLEATATAIASGSGSDARFVRANSSLYIDAVYDGHFDLSLVGHSLTSAYAKLGGPAPFGARLPPSQLSALAGAYSIPAVRLEPHPRDAANGG